MLLSILATCTFTFRGISKVFVVGANANFHIRVIVEISAVSQEVCTQKWLDISVFS